MRRMLLILTGVVLTLGSMSSVASAAPRGHFDLQAHRGGIGLTTESTIAGFEKALRLGVTTLELDTQVTRDLRVVVTHDRKVSAQKCQDTAPATPGDPQYPYAGKFIKDLTLAQIRTLNCGYQRLPDFPNQQQINGAKIIELREVFDLVKRLRAHGVKLNIETKVEAGAPSETQPRNVFVPRVYAEIAASGLAHQVTIQSFDWGALQVMRTLNSSIPLIALTNKDFLQVGKPGASPWLGGVDADDFGGDLIRTAKAAVPGLKAISPVQGVPQNGAIGDVGFTPYPDRKMITNAHRAGLKVIPWTVDDPATMRHFIDLGVDGLITNYPDRLRTVMAQAGLVLPRSY